MSETVRPIHIPGVTALSSLRQRVHEALVSWSRDWAGDAPLEISVSSPPQSDSCKDYEVVRNAAGCIWFRCGEPERRDVGRAVVGAELMPRGSHADDWIASVVDQARHARDIVVFASLLGDVGMGEPVPSNALPPASVFAPGSGAVQFSCPFLGLHAIASAAVWKSVPPLERRANVSPLTPLDRAAENTSVRLEVLLGTVEVELPKLLDLNPGDILRLPRRLEQPLDVMCDGRYVARAELGEVSGRRGVQLVDHQ
jgi:hypothetical protein